MWPKIAKEILATSPNENSPIKKILQPILINYYVRLQQLQQQKRKNLQLPRVRYIHSKDIK